MALTLMGVRHLISSKWLEKMESFSLSYMVLCHNLANERFREVTKQ